MWTGFKSQRRRHMWFKFVVVSSLLREVFLWVLRLSPLLKNIDTSKIQLDLERTDTLKRVLYNNLRACNHVPVTPRRLSCQISANQREAETSGNVNKHWKTRAKGNVVITSVISANQHFAKTKRVRFSSFKVCMDYNRVWSMRKPSGLAFYVRQARLKSQ